MKKLLLTASALVLGLSIANSAMADCNGMYLGVRAGVAKHNYSDKGNSPINTDGLDKNKLMLSGAIGYRYNYFRTELEYVWRDKNDRTITYKNTPGLSNNVSIRTFSYMLNGYIDFAPYHWLTPYVGAGVGFTKLKYSDVMNVNGEKQSLTTKGNYRPTRFTWSVGGGLSVKVTNRFNVDAGYRYYDMGSIHKMDVKAHEFYGGLRYVF